MAEQNELDRLYLEAKSALKAREYDRAAGLLTQILVIDENYRDASRLLAQAVKLKRRRWYNDPRVWGTLGILLLIGLGILIFPKISSRFAAQPPPQIATTTTAPSLILRAAATATLLPTPTPIPLTWKRIYTGQDFPRDNIRAIVVSPKDPELLYTGAEGSGIFKSIDGGVSWQPIGQGLNHASLYTLTLNPENPDILLAGFVPGVLYRTTNGGETWQQMEVHERREIGCGSSVVVDPQNPEHILWAGGCASIYESLDGGETWSPIQKEDDESRCPNVISALAFDPLDSQTVYATQMDRYAFGCRAGLYRSVDGGRSYKPTGAYLRFIFQSRLAIGLDEKNNKVIVAHGVLSSGEEDTLISRDGGIIWEKSPKQCNVMASRPDGSMIALCKDGLNSTDIGLQNWKRIASLDAPGNYYTFAISPTDPNRIFFGSQRIQFSGDGGKTWTDRSNGLPAERMELKIDPSDSVNLYAWQNRPYGVSEDKLIFESNDSGRAWELTAQAGFGLTFDADGKTLYRGDIDSFWRKDLESGNWTHLPLPGDGFVGLSADPWQAGHLFALMGGASLTLFTSQDKGNTWEKGFASASPYELSSPAFHFPPSDSNTIYISWDNAPPARSGNGGLNWSLCGDPKVYSGFSPSESRLVIAPDNENILYLATSGYGVLKSDDACLTWTLINTGFGSLFVNTLAIDPNNPDTIYAGTDGGVHVSFDSGQTWGQVNDGLLGATVVYSIAVDKDSNVYAATPYGIFKLENK